MKNMKNIFVKKKNVPLEKLL